MKYIPYGRQSISKKDIEAVAKVLSSDWITQGPEVDKFESAVARFCGVKYAVAVSSGTAALHIACLAAGLKKGDEAVTTPLTFLATANSVLYSGARPVFADVEYRTGNIDPDAVSSRITKRTRAILPVHFGGLPCDMEAIHRIAKKKGLIVIEDACHALGAEYSVKEKGKSEVPTVSGGGKEKWFKVGCCEHSDMTVFSFHPVKHITTGEGGMITTNDERLYKRLKAFRTHGVYKTEEMARREGPWFYEMRDLGFNYRITDFQCALGSSQLAKLGTFLKERRELARSYDRVFSEMPFTEIPYQGDSERHAYHLYALRMDFPKMGTTRKIFMNALKQRGILAQVHYLPVYLHPYYRDLGYKKGSCPRAEEFYEREISMPLFPAMDGRDIEKVVSRVKNIVRRNGK